MKRLALPVAVVALTVAFVVLFGRSPAHQFTPPTHFPAPDAGEAEPPAADGLETATFGSGCFWCTEAVFQRLQGVQSAVSGYSGGTVPDPSYDEVCTGTTGHAEVVQVTYDPAVVTYPQLLEVFWRSHDPTERDRQGDDVGPQYRSVVFYHTDRQRQLAERYRRRIDAAGVYAAPIVTEIEPFTGFYPAGPDHQDYYDRHMRRGYCRVVIGPKLEKLKAIFGDRWAEPDR